MKQSVFRGELTVSSIRSTVICLVLSLWGWTGCSRPILEPRTDFGKRLSELPIFKKQAPLSIGGNWRPDLAILPFAEFDGNEVVIRHVRNCRYRTESDYDVRHYDLRFQLNDVRTIDFVVVPFRDSTLLAHTMVSFGLVNGQQIAISVEARLDEGESYSPLRGAGNRFELMYVIADERDVIPLRTNVRNVEVYLYRGRATPEQAQDLLVDMLARANKLQREPEFYDTLRNNCTTNLVEHVNKLRPGRIPFDWRVVLPGQSDRLAFDLGLIETNLSFEDTKRLAHITSTAKQFADSPDLSAKIRGR